MKVTSPILTDETGQHIAERISELTTALDRSNVKSVNDINAVKVDLEDDGRVIIYHTDKEIINNTAQRIKDICKEVEFGKIYNCKVVKVEEFGAFVELWPGCEGLIHISQLDEKRVEKTSDIVKAISREIKPDIVIVVDALCSRSVERLNRVIQISNTGISPGSGVGNKRKIIMGVQTTIKKFI